MLDLAENPQHRQPKTFGPFFGTLVGLPLLFLAAPLSIPYGLILNAWYRARGKRFARQMAPAGRTISFADCIPALGRGEGTLIQEWKTPFTGPTRCWWTGDDLFTKGPSPVADCATMTPGSNAPRFTQACFDDYIDILDGKAFLVVVEKQQRKLFRETLRNAARIDLLTHTSEGW